MGVYPSEFSVSLQQFVSDMKSCEEECRHQALSICQKCLVTARQQKFGTRDDSDVILNNVLQTQEHLNGNNLNVALQTKRINERDVNDLLRNTWVG
ncbi:unnamed protein product [Bursaphelenchus okinawaensis]|uniref:Uncharacterized protein n=1 Tax=Bursaphelenchus okinawaensis TaxID=465554 RepID=A0A811JZJ5_9BILA|nr:unnamed protein product [Bursaphelenchus okinawaensis]CAG9088278.1 unnamed protein product [Bursaphelenchus okinawaensis]